MKHAYLLTYKISQIEDHYVFMSKQDVQRSIDITWSRNQKEKPEIVWKGNNATAGEHITVKLVGVYDEPEHL